jgi:glycosyltransferase involved in cell wall biosynthesis
MAEPFGLVVPEAMAFGLPVVASRFGGPGEVLDATCGLLFDPAKPSELAAHLAQLVMDPTHRSRLGEGARRRVERYSVTGMVRVILGVYARFLGAPRSDGASASHAALTQRMEVPPPHSGSMAGTGQPDQH